MLRIFNVLGIIAGIFSFLNSKSLTSQLWILPILYSLLLYIYRKQKSTASGPGMIALNITMFLRYVVSIWVFYVAGEYGKYTVKYTYIDEAAYLMAYELVAIFLAMIFIKISKKKNKIKRLVNIDHHRMSIICCLVVVVLLFIGVTYMHIGIGMNILVSGDYTGFYDIDSNISEGTHYIEIIWQTLCVWLYVYLIMVQKHKYNYDRKGIHIILSMIFTFLLILITFVEQTAINRWYTIITTSATLALLIKLYPKYSKGISLTIIIPPALVVMLATLIKNAGFVAGSGSIDEAFIKLFNPSEMDSYFGGPVGVSNAIALGKGEFLGFINVFLDIFKSFPALGHFISGSTTGELFNKSVGRGDLIIPLIGQSYYYFGYIFSPILSIISVALIKRLDKSYKDDFTFTCYIKGFTTIWLGVEAMALNITICSNWFFIRIIPFFIALWLTNKANKQFISSYNPQLKLTRPMGILRNGQ